MAANPVPSLTPAEYLALDRASDVRHEYTGGQMYAMSGGTMHHAVLINEVGRALGNALEGRSCVVPVANLRLQIAGGSAYLYPDVMVICGAPQYVDGHRDMIRNPTVIVEVLSDSTERWDRTGKFAHYRRIPSLREYVLVSQNEPIVDWFTLRDNGEWVYRQAAGLDAQCQLDSLGISISLEQLYRRIELPPLTAPPPT